MNRIEQCFEIEREEDRPLVCEVVVPACAEHGGHYDRVVRLWWFCPLCGSPRGDVYQTLSYDGSRRLSVHGWINPCGHVDGYKAVRAEARANGLNA